MRAYRNSVESGPADSAWDRLLFSTKLASVTAFVMAEIPVVVKLL